MLHQPKVNLAISQNNFVFKSCSIWNVLINDILEKSPPNNNGVIIRGFSQNSDFCATIPFIKNKLKSYLLNLQSLGDIMEWLPENSLQK